MDMQRIPTKTHGVFDYATAALLLTGPGLLGLRPRNRVALGAAGLGVLASSLVTDYELGVWRKLPMRAHLYLDGTTGMTLFALAPSAGGGFLDKAFPALVGLGEIAGAAFTEPTPRTGETPEGTLTDAAVPAASDPRIPDPPAPQASYPVADAPAAPAVAAAPFETPGPSVPAAAGGPLSDTEREERADLLREDPDFIAEQTDDPMEALVEEEEAAAAAEVRMMGGPDDLDAGGDPAMEPVYEAGGGEAEGFELAEADLIENATHGEGHGNPLRDAIAPEAESDLSLDNVAYSEPDQEDVTEVVADPDDPSDEDDPGRGPGITADR